MILILGSYALLSVLWLSSPGVVNIASGQEERMINATILEKGDNSQCASMEERERARNEIHQFVDSVVVSLYTCNGTPGWRRVAFINMTDTSYNCPSGLNLTSYSKRTCGRNHTTSDGCSSTTFSAGGLPYSRVCGRMRGYQIGITAAFLPTVSSRSNPAINSSYVDGISLTHGGSGNRQHIWTFAAAFSEVVSTASSNFSCPCNAASPSVVPAFVGNDYFCESGVQSDSPDIDYTVLFSDDPLWDGRNCTSASTCCQFNNPPWFTKNLPSATTDDIELRLCTAFSLAFFADIPLELIELYVQ